MAGERKYSDSEMRDILGRALESQGADPSALSHAELLAIGEQVGVPPEAMARAAAEISQAKLDELATRSLKAKKRKWLAAHAAVFALVNALLFTVNFLTTPGEWWVLFSVFFWGLALAAHAGVAAFVGSSPSPGALAGERRKLEAGRARLRIGALASEAPAPEASASHEASVGEASERAASRSATRP